MECPICYEIMDLTYETPCHHQFCYLCLKTSYILQNRKCPLCRGDLPVDLCNNAILKDNIEIPSICWAYSGRKGGMWYYDITSNEIIEEAYQKFLLNNENKKIKMIILGKTYNVNFSKMIQKGDNGSRKIFRLDSNKDIVNVKGIAGLRINK